MCVLKQPGQLLNNRPHHCWSWSCHSSVKTWFQFLQGTKSIFLWLTWNSFWWLILTFFCSPFLSISPTISLLLGGLPPLYVLLLYFTSELPSGACLLPHTSAYPNKTLFKCHPHPVFLFSLCVVIVSSGSAEMIPHLYLLAAPQSLSALAHANLIYSFVCTN